MALDLLALRADYAEIFPRLETVARDLEKCLRHLVNRNGVKGANVTSRVKTVDSFLKKAWQRSLTGEPWQNALRDCPDKIGCRIDVVYLADVYALAGAVKDEESLDVQKLEDKAVQLGPDALGYGGVHVDLIPDALPEGLTGEYARCEVQLRTHAQAAWAMASHELGYKGPMEITDDQRRRLNRLTALVELFDDVVDQVSKEIMDSPDYPLAVLIRRLESLWLRIVGRSYSDALTRTVLSELLDTLSKDEANALIERVSEFVDSHRAEIVAASEEDHPILTQPESMLVYYCLSSDKYTFTDQWQEKGLDWDLLDSAAIKLGVRLPQPH